MIYFDYNSVKKYAYSVVSEAGCGTKIQVEWYWLSGGRGIHTEIN